MSHALDWQSQDPLFFAVELDTYAPGSLLPLTVAQGIGTRPRGALAETESAIASTFTLYASDLGYRTPPAPGPVQVYPPFLDTGFAINRTLQLDPLGSAVAVSFGAVSLLNPSGQYDAIAAANNSDTRGVRIYAGRKSTSTDARRLLVDPAYSDLTPVFSGLAQTWALTETALTVPIRDPSYWLAKPLQTGLYGGTGGLDGIAALAGAPKPKLRGGSASAPVRNITPLLIDPVNLIYQYSDAAGAVVTLYEGGDGANILPSGNVANLYAGTTAPGHYRTNNATGTFQLGSTPASGRLITVDAWGQFPLAGAVSTPVALAAALLAEDCAMPAAYVDSAAFAAVDTLFANPAGVYWPSGSNVVALDAVSGVLASINARLMPSRAGLLRPYLIRAIPPGTVPAVTFSPDNVVNVTRQALPATLDPPTAAWRVGYQHNYTPQTTGLSPAALPATVTYLAQTDLYASSASTAIIAAYRHPNYPAALAGALLDLTGAQAVADSLVGVWGTRRRVFAVEVPLALGLAYDLGAVVRLQYPIEDMATGQLGQIIGEACRTADNTMTYQVLV